VRHSTSNDAKKSELAITWPLAMWCVGEENNKENSMKMRQVKRSKAM
jgi:hypothetical protein